MKTTAADLLVERLEDWGVEVVFGLPGDGINGIMEALRQREAAIRFVQVRHEESAAFMACAYAKFTGRIGVCLATSGPGGLHLLNGLYDAKLDCQPVLAITGLQFHDLIGSYSQQDVELDKVFMDVAKLRGGRRPSRTAAAAQGHARAGEAFRSGAGARHAPSGEDRPDGALGQGARAALEVEAHLFEGSRAHLVVAPCRRVARAGQPGR